LVISISVGDNVEPLIAALSFAVLVNQS